jgi:hypothetical protein
MQCVHSLVRPITPYEEINKNPPKSVIGSEEMSVSPPEGCAIEGRHKVQKVAFEASGTFTARALLSGGALPKSAFWWNVLRTAFQKYVNSGIYWLRAKKVGSLSISIRWSQRRQQRPFCRSRMIASLVTVNFSITASMNISLNAWYADVRPSHTFVTWFF